MLKLSWRIILVSLAITVAALVAVAMVLTDFTGAQSRGTALEDLPQLFPPDNKALGQVVIKIYHEYRANAVRWSAAYFGSLFGSACLSALAGLVLKIELLQTWPRARNDVAAFAAMLAALLITLSTTGDFQRKWQANRIAAAAMENLAYELVNPQTPADLRAVVVEIQTINDARNKGIVGEQTRKTARLICDVIFKKRSQNEYNRNTKNECDRAS